MTQMLRCSMHRTCPNNACMHKHKHTATPLCHKDWVCYNHGNFEVTVSCEIVYRTDINPVHETK